jgi:exopolysaccharide biosynthesis polyprenyl glycosylphosphotransferase
VNRATLSPRQRFEQRIVAALVAGDVLACLAAMALAYILRLYIPEDLLTRLQHSPDLYARAAPVVVGLWFIAFFARDLYDVRRFRSRFAEAVATLSAVALAAILVAAASFMSRTDYSRAMLILFWLSGSALAVIERSLLSRYREHRLSRPDAESRTAIVGCGELGRVVAERVLRFESLGYALQGFVCGRARRPETIDGLPVLGGLDDLREICEAHRLDEVLVAQPQLDVDRLMSLIADCRELPVQFNLVAGPLELLTGSMEIAGVADLPVVPLGRKHFAVWQEAVKRGLDIIGGALLLILTAPVWLIVPPLVRRETGASALFEQTRIGFDGEPFTMLKFRTMRPEADPYAPSPTDDNDERITPIGRWLRRFSLDELPQLINVLRGEMSLVGPRPEMPFIVERYQPWQRLRLQVRPGLTGLWQILGRKDLPLVENIEYDFYYINNRSLLMDLVILLRTVPVVLRGRGAY